MDLEHMIEQLATQAEIIRHLSLNISDVQASWKPDRDSWSILEVINHLYDEEREDFRAHLKQTIEPSKEEWKRIDPQGWVKARQYNQRSFTESIDNFLEERQTSLDWLRSLSSVDWDAVKQAPFGTITAGDLLASWAAHDLLHTRQLVELRWAITLLSVKPYSVQYAGDW